MGNSKGHPIDAYQDVHRVVVEAWATKREVTMEFADEKKAFKFVGRCGSYRRLLRRYEGRCEYDGLRISRSGKLVTITPWADTLPPIRDAKTGEIIEPTPALSNTDIDAMINEERQKEKDRQFIEWAKRTNPGDPISDLDKLGKKIF